MRELLPGQRRMFLDGGGGGATVTVATGKGRYVHRIEVIVGGTTLTVCDTVISGFLASFEIWEKGVVAAGDIYELQCPVENGNLEVEVGAGVKAVVVYS